MASPTPAQQPESEPDPQRWLADHGDMLYAMARRRVASREAAEDLVQETLLAAVRGLDGYRGEAAVQTWLVSILQRKVIDHYRHAAAERRGGGAEPVLSLSGFFDGEGFWLEPVAEWGADPAADLERADLADDLAACAAALPDTLRDAYVLREMQDTPAEEVCQALNITASNLWARLHRARLAMRACLERRWSADTPKPKPAPETPTDPADTTASPDPP